MRAIAVASILAGITAVISVCLGARIYRWEMITWMTYAVGWAFCWLMADRRADR